MTAGRIVLALSIVAIFASDAVPMTRDERHASVLAREARIDACHFTCVQQCIDRTK